MKVNCLVVYLMFAFIFGLTVAVSSGKAQDIKFSARQSEKVKASSISWSGHFGGRKEEPENLYILMTQGGFRAPTSKDFESLIRNWLKDHPNADAVVVYTIDGMRNNAPDSKMKAVWVLDGADNLNIYLVRKGGCPAGTMLLNKGDETSLSKDDYETYAEKIIEAGVSAKKEKLGIWNDEDSSAKEQ